MAKKENTNTSIATNRKASFDYELSDRYVAGIALSGWEVKALRAGKVQIADSYVIIRRTEAFWLGGLINPLPTASTHVVPDPSRTRKLLLKRSELNQLIGLVERKGFTLIPTKLFWSNRHIKLEFAVGAGKKKHDKREAIKDRDWQREQGRLRTTNIGR